MAGKWSGLTLTLGWSGSNMYMFSIRLYCLLRWGSLGLMGTLRSREKKQSFMEGDLAGEGKSLHMMESW